ncbi:MAG: hypothetical protein F6K00_27725 [Leptolyngbya sp. SIOISBB]|nr:hypothetical protein [Leptolyngbya sp. SIOISBB]
MAIAYTLATWYSQHRQHVRIDHYAGRIQEPQDKTLRHSHFSLGLYGRWWLYAMELWAERATQLMLLKPQKRRFFQGDLQALALMQQALSACCPLLRNNLFN